ncbi:hypothetical protein ANANG_G00277410 [Anguilla anguilla]|uniref:Uncharacterized protein n=1 Tax=Anguilla anguilla TaxID=7936 RepID=A0A9D3LN14_ANGAN|nr:hypothetical protein ANANG_G00277410 [Anguilla anguilla]
MFLPFLKPWIIPLMTKLRHSEILLMVASLLTAHNGCNKQEPLKAVEGHKHRQICFSPAA